jgi:hypothetical protein
MNDGVQQQTQRVYENMALLPLDLFARVIAMRIDAGPPCMGPFLSSGFQSGASSVSLSDLESGFFVPTCSIAKADARRSCQGWSSPQPRGALRPCQAIP